MSSTVKNIIFDFGGIFIEIDYKKTEDAFVQAGITQFANFYSQNNASKVFEDLETGKITEENFYNLFRQVANTNIPNNAIKNCWNAMIGNYLTQEIQWLTTIASKYNIYLFSNTNIIHYNFFANKYEQQFGNFNFNSLFKKAYYSHTLGLRKPYKESFEKILQEQNLAAAETLFIDDTEKNLQGAMLAGLQVTKITPPQSVLSLGL